MNKPAPHKKMPTSTSSLLSALARLGCHRFALLGFFALLTACAGMEREHALVDEKPSPIANSGTTTDDLIPPFQTHLSETDRNTSAIILNEEQTRSDDNPDVLVKLASAAIPSETIITENIYFASTTNISPINKAVDNDFADSRSMASEHVLISDHLISESLFTNKLTSGNAAHAEIVADNDASEPANKTNTSTEKVNTSLPANKAVNEEIFVEKDKPRDLWQRLRQGFRLSSHNDPRARPHLDWYVRNQAYLDRVVERARPFLYDIVQEIERNDLPMEIALLPIVESAFQPFAYSPGRAAGIWQFIPSTGRRYGLKQNWWYDGRRDVPAATRAAINYLKVLQKHFDGDWLLALAAYNSGEGRVLKAVKKNRAKGKPIDFWSLDLPNETRGYVPKLLAISAIVNNTEKYGITLASIPDRPYLQQVNIGSQIDLALAAELADLPIETLYRLNPAFNRWATDPKGPHVLSLPKEKANAFRASLASVDRRVQWQRHRIRQGETLSSIAEKYQTTIKLLQQVNNIRDKWIRAGNNIIIPVSSRNLKHYLSADQRKLAIQHTPRNGSKTQHTVKKGDTLWDLSRKYSTTVSELASWNAMAPRDSLMPGQRLVIWTQKTPIPAKRLSAHPSNQAQQRLQYRVRKGDSLARIAKKFRVTINNLRNWNSLPKNKYLQPGQRLTLYIDVTRQS